MLLIITLWAQIYALNAILPVNHVMEIKIIANIVNWDIICLVINVSSHVLLTILV